MTRFEEKWEDPISPEMFFPTDERVDAILTQANRQAINEKTPRRKLVMAAGILAFTIIGCAVAVRSFEAMWGSRAISPKYAAAPGTATAKPEIVSAQMPQPTDASGGVASGSRTSMAAAATQAAQPSQAPSGSSARPDTDKPSAVNGTSSSSGSSGGSGSTLTAVLPGIEALCASADVIAAGSFEDGVFVVEEGLKGACPDRIALPGASSLRGWALLFLVEREGALEFAGEPYLFRMDGGRLTARDASGAPMASFDQGETDLTLEAIRELCAGV